MEVPATEPVVELQDLRTHFFLKEGVVKAVDGVNLAALALDWRPGDNVVVEDIEYPSVVYPWARARARGVAPCPPEGPARSRSPRTR